MSIPIRRPISSDPGRKPDRAIVRDVAPLPVVVEVFVARHLGRHVVGRLETILAAVPLEAPVVEIVVGRNLGDVVTQLVSTVKASFLPGHYGVGISTAGYFAAPLPDGDPGLAAVAVYIDPVLTGTLRVERQVWRVDLKPIVIIEVPHAQNHRPL